MADIRGATGCINHPGVEAVARCRQCGKPVCGACVVIGPSGKFCSESCRDQHQRFIERARELDLKKGRGIGLFKRLKRRTVKVVMFALAILMLATVLTYLNILDIPVLRDVINRFL